MAKRVSNLQTEFSLLKSAQDKIPKAMKEEFEPQFHRFDELNSAIRNDREAVQSQLN